MPSRAAFSSPERRSSGCVMGLRSGARARRPNSSAGVRGSGGGGQATRLRVLRVDGGAAANDFLMQYQADLLGIRVERPHVVETTALGAGLLAGLATGVWGSHRDLDHARRIDRVFVPAKSKAWRDAEYERWRRAVLA